MLKKKSIIIAIVLATLAIGAAFAYVEYIYPRMIQPADTYANARSLYKKGQFMQAALTLESISGYSDSSKLAKQAWKNAGDQAYNEGNFDMASACYIKAGSNEEDVARMDECYLRLAENAFAKDQISRGEIYLNCVSSSDVNTAKTDEIRINAAERLLNGGLTETNIDSAIDRLDGCSEAVGSRIVDRLIGWGEKALDGFDADAAGKLFLAAKRFSPEDEAAAAAERINNAWTEAGKRALEKGMDSFAQRCFAMSGFVPEIENPEELYLNAVDLFGKNDLFGALALFRYLGDYKNCPVYTDEIAKSIMHMPQAGNDSAYAILSPNGTVELFGGGWETGNPQWTDIKAIAIGNTSSSLIGVKENGMAVSVGRNYNGILDVDSWTEVIDVACGSGFSIGLRENGTVLFAGSFTSGGNDTAAWQNVVSIGAGDSSCFGVMQNGFVLAAGDNSLGQCDVSTWDNIMQVSGGSGHTVGLRKDGTVIACGDNTYGQCDVSDWSDVVFVSAGAFHTVALRADGTLLACGRNDSGECAVSSFRSVAAVSAGSGYTLMIFEDGTNRVIGRTN